MKKYDAKGYELIDESIDWQGELIRTAVAFAVGAVLGILIMRWLS